MPKFWEAEASLLKDMAAAFGRPDVKEWALGIQVLFLMDRNMQDALPEMLVPHGP